MIALVVVACFGSAVLTAQDRTAKKSEFLVKAAIVAKMTPYVSWPKGLLKSGKTLFTLGVFGDARIGRSFEQAFARVKVHGCTVRIVRLPAWPVHDPKGDPKKIKYRAALAAVQGRILGCHALFVSKSAEESFAEIREFVRRRPVWIVADSQGLARQGAHISFKLKKAKVRFDSNARASRAAGVQMSAKLLRLGDVAVK